MDTILKFLSLTFALLLSITTVLTQSAQESPTVASLIKPLKTTAQRIVEHGYVAETHTVTTEDGYILTIFRIPYSHRLQNSHHEQRPIVLLQHGLFSTSDFWLLNGPNDALPFMLSDAGYDVWLGNARGNHYARNHTNRTVQQSSFWRFSWHEIGHYDIPAMVDYALKVSNMGERQKALHYIGYSQGTTAFFTFLATRPTWNVHIKTAHMLAPVAYLGNATYPAMRMLGPFLGQDNTYSRLLAHQEFVPQNELLLLMFFNTCGTQGTFFEWCLKLLPWISLMQNNARLNNTISTFMLDIFPGGCSTDQIIHYMQSHVTGDFRQYDFGRTKNSQVYGQSVPPRYDLDSITVDMHLWYSDNDAFANVDDVLRLSKHLPSKTLHHIEDPEWDHGEFLYSIFVKSVINEPIIEILEAYEMKSHMMGI